MRWMIALVLALAGCGDSGPKALPDGSLEVRVKALSDHVTAVAEVVKGESLMITFFKPNVADGNNWTWNLFVTTKAVLSRLKEASKGTDYKQVTFMAQVPTQNNLGQAGQQLGMKVTYDMTKLTGAQWDKMTDFDMAELPVEVSFKPLGREMAKDYCAESEQLSPTFCAYLKSRSYAR